MSRTSSATFAPAGSQGWLDSLTESNPQQELWRLPDAMTDPFSNSAKRLEATLDSYRFTTEPRSLMDWAVTQTGLGDPMTKFTRHELEQGFERFAHNRDQHLKKLVKQMRAGGEGAAIHNIRRYLKVPAAVSALDKAGN